MIEYISISGATTINQLAKNLGSSRTWAEKILKKGLINGLVIKSAKMTGKGKGRESFIYTITKIGAREAGSNWTPYKTANSITRSYLKSEYLSQNSEQPISITFFEKQASYQLDGSVWPFKVDKNGKVGGRDCLVLDNGDLVWPFLFDGEERVLTSVINAVIKNNKKCIIICRKMDKKRVEKLIESGVRCDDNSGYASLFNIPRSRREWISYHTSNKDNISFANNYEKMVKALIGELPKNDESVKKAIMKNGLPDNITVESYPMGRIEIL